MGQGGSSSRSGSSSMERSSSSHSHRARLRQKLRRIRRRCNFTSKHATSPTAFKLVSADDFAGIALLTLISAEMKFKDRWIACVSLGEQTFRTDISDQRSYDAWNEV
uniref:Uncharacterized protein n=1 Tax=Opuntia streptacantha TaxID=393608 RepID=A0A7C8YBN4_OPUST